MKKNYGFKVGDKVTNDGDKGVIIEIFPARKNGLGFVHAEVKWEKRKGYGWLTGLSHLKKAE